MKNFHFLVCLMLLTSCASLSEKDCKNANWQDIGRKDGLRGSSSDRLASHREACAEYGISPVDSEYQSGFSVGNNEYCINKGKSDGKAGREGKTPSTCGTSKNYKSSFSEGYKLFCKNEGVKAGAAADKTMGRSNCRGKSYYNSGFKEGLVSYCTTENALTKGKKALENKGKLCPSNLRADFMASYKEGINFYCTRINGFGIGKAKKDIRPHMCPSSLRSSFESAYKKGIEYNSLRAKIKVLDEEISKLNTKISDPEASSDLKSYLTKELVEKKVTKKTLNVRMIKIEGYVGI